MLLFHRWRQLCNHCHMVYFDGNNFFRRQPSQMHEMFIIFNHRFQLILLRRPIDWRFRFSFFPWISFDMECLREQFFFRITFKCLAVFHKITSPFSNTNRTESLCSMTTFSLFSSKIMFLIAVCVVFTNFFCKLLNQSNAVAQTMPFVTSNSITCNYEWLHQLKCYF